MADLDPFIHLDQMGDFVRDMHTASGLLEELPHGIALADAEQQVLDFITSYVKEPRKAALAGNSVGTDRTFLVRDMPQVESHLHYRNVDVSSFKEVIRRWHPAEYSPPPKKNKHEALSDIHESLDELRYYRDRFIAPRAK